jgi:hypothetical protein
MLGWRPPRYSWKGALLAINSELSPLIDLAIWKILSVVGRLHCGAAAAEEGPKSKLAVTKKKPKQEECVLSPRTLYPAAMRNAISPIPCKSRCQRSMFAVRGHRIWELDEVNWPCRSFDILDATRADVLIMR